MEKNQKNKNGMREGYWEEYNNNHKLFYKGHFKNGYVVGYWELYNVLGQLTRKEYYLVD